MARAQLKGVVRGTGGRTIANAKVFVYEAGTSNPVADLYAASSGGSPQDWLLSNLQGEYEGWLTTPRNVAVECTDNNDQAYYSNTVSAEAVPETEALATHLADPDAHPYLRELIYQFEHVGDLAVNVGNTLHIYFHRDTTLSEFVYVLTDAPEGDDLTFDAILWPPGGGSSSIFASGNKPTIEDGEDDSTRIVSSWTPDTTEIVAGSTLTLQVTQVGSSVPGADLTGWIIGS